MSEKVANEQDFLRIGEKRTLLNNILRRKANWIGHILTRNYFLHDLIEGQMTEVKEEGRITQLLDDLRNRRRYWELKGELKIEIHGNDSLLIEHKEEIYIFHKSMDLLVSSILNNN